MKKFGERLRVLREKHGYTQQKLADTLFVSKALISAYELGKRTPPFTGLEEIADYFDVSTDYLLGRTLNTKSHK